MSVITYETQFENGINVDKKFLLDISELPIELTYCDSWDAIITQTCKGRKKFISSEVVVLSFIMESDNITKAMNTIYASYWLRNYITYSSKHKNKKIMNYVFLLNEEITDYVKYQQIVIALMEHFKIPLFFQHFMAVNYPKADKVHFASSHKLDVKRLLSCYYKSNNVVQKTNGKYINLLNKNQNN